MLGERFDSPLDEPGDAGGGTHFEAEKELVEVSLQVRDADDAVPHPLWPAFGEAEE